jgi:tRNA G18 (ribose-2'-O)-methylase SpoU
LSCGRAGSGENEQVSAAEPTPGQGLLVPVVRADDERLADYVRLRETSLRRSLESERGLFIAEGDKVIRRAVEAGYRPRSFLLAERWLAGLGDVVTRWPDVPVYLVTEELAEQVTGFHVHRGALASLHREERHRVGDLLQLQRLVVCEDIVDHTNVGALLRNAAGLGWDGVLLSPRSADPLYRRSIKVSMGAVFSLPWARLADWHAAPDQLQEAGFTTVALTLAPDSVDLAEVAADLAERPGRVALLVGTEGAGLSPRWSGTATVRARIPMAAGIDSLNVAAATAVACYVLNPGQSSSSSSSSSKRLSRGETGQSSG